MDHPALKEMPTRATGWASPTPNPAHTPIGPSTPPTPCDSTPSPSPSQERLAQFGNLIGWLGFKAAEFIQQGDRPFARKCLDQIRPVLDYVSARLNDVC